MIYNVCPSMIYCLSSLKKKSNGLGHLNRGLKTHKKIISQFFSNEQVHYVIPGNTASVKRERKDLLLSNFLGIRSSLCNKLSCC